MASFMHRKHVAPIAATREAFDGRGGAGRAAPYSPSSRTPKHARPAPGSSRRRSLVPPFKAMAPFLPICLIRHHASRNATAPPLGESARVRPRAHAEELEVSSHSGAREAGGGRG